MSAHTSDRRTTPLSIAQSLPEVTNNHALPFTTNILVVGGSYAGLAAVKSFKTHFEQRSLNPLYSAALENRTPKISITLVEPKSGLLNIIGIPKAVVDPEFAQTQYIPFDQLNQLSFDRVVSNDPSVLDAMEKSHNCLANFKVGIELNFVHGEVTTLDEKSASYKLNNSDDESTIEFDYVVIASGRNRKWPISPLGYTKDSYIEEMQKFKNSVENHKIISVIGAGAVGIELAGDIKCAFPEKTVNLIHPHTAFPPEPLSQEFSDVIRDSLTRSGVNVILNTRISKELPGGDLETTSGTVIESDLNHWCTSFHNNTQIFAPKLAQHFVTPKNNVLVNEYLQLDNKHVKHPNMFALGDLVELPIIKSAGWAMYMGRQVANNITSLILDDKLVEPLPNIAEMPRGMVLVAGNGDIVSELTGEVELNNTGYVKEYKDYCVGKILATLNV